MPRERLQRFARLASGSASPCHALILDYGNVLTLEQPAEWCDTVGEHLGARADDVRRAYWEHRQPYDAGLTAEEYWGRVLASIPRRTRTHEPTALTRWLVDADIAGWTHFREEMWAVAKAFRARGGRTAILSNGGPEITAGLRARRRLEDWFDVVVVSYEVGVCKPDPRIYEVCLSRLGVDAPQALFVDDRAENVDAAAKLGLQTVHFTSDGLLPEIRARIDGR